MTMRRRLRICSCLCAAIIVFAFCSSASAQESRATGWIAIPAAEYQALRAKAYPVEPEPEAPPVQATLTRIDYDLRINGELATGQARLTVDVIKDGWVRVPIPSSLLVREAKLDGKLVSLVAGAKATDGKSAVFSHQGRAVLVLDIVIPVIAAAANESIVLPPALAGITRASVQLPRQGVDIKLTGGFLAEKSATESDSKWLAYGRGNEALVFSWWRKADDHRSSQPLRLRGSLTELVGLGEDTTSVQAEVNAEVVQGAATEIKIRLPEKVTVNQVAGAMVADWEMKPGELGVTFLEPVEKTARFVIVGEIRLPREGQVEIPMLRLLNSERETGGVAVEVLGAGEITDRKFSGLEGADATDLGEIVSGRQSPSLIAFRFRSGDANAERALAVNVARYTQESVLMANIEEARYQVLMSAEGKTLVQARYAIRNNRKNFLQITLPKDATVWSATLSGKPVRPGQAPDGSLLLPLEKGRAGEEAPAFAAEVLYFNRGEKWNENGKAKLALPVLDLPVSRTGLLYYHPPLYKVTPEPGSFRSDDYQDPISAVLTRGGSGGGRGSGMGPEISASERVDTPNELPLVNSNVLDLMKVQGGVAAAGQGKSEKDTRVLVDKYLAQSQEGKRAGILPINLSFPAFGPSIFLVSELTAEKQSPTIDISYEAAKKGGAR
ncbi:MAG: hypothetical protein JXA73_02315 [Acidobacteria bacterium]|nr:hypothetical protein [Acidobacteriota bacterium]